MFCFSFFKTGPVREKIIRQVLCQRISFILLGTVALQHYKLIFGQINYLIPFPFAEASVKRHFYYSMKNCTSADDLTRRLPTIVDDYQVLNLLSQYD